MTGPWRKYVNRYEKKGKQGEYRIPLPQILDQEEYLRPLCHDE
jgi:hypothetical protein